MNAATGIQLRPLLFLAAIAMLSGCSCADAYAASTEARLVAGDTDFEIVFGAPRGSPHFYIQLDDCAADQVLVIDGREMSLSSPECRTEDLCLSFGSLAVSMRVRSSDAYDTVLTVVSPGTDDLDDCSELFVESVRQLD